VTLSSAPVDSATVNLTAQTNQDVGPTPYYIDIINQSTGETVGSCSEYTTCSAQVSLDASTYIAEVDDENDPPTIVAQSAPLTLAGGNGVIDSLKPGHLIAWVQPQTLSFFECANSWFLSGGWVPLRCRGAAHLGPRCHDQLVDDLSINHMCKYHSEMRRCISLPCSLLVVSGGRG
jgi:hypothetical protein